MAGQSTEKSTPRAGSSTKYATPALEKGLDILELLAREPDGLTKSELARRLDRSMSEIFRMLVCLEERGYIAQVAGDRYLLTLKLFQLAQEHPPTERLLAEALPVMKRMAHKVRQSCHLAVLDNDKVVILAQVNPPTDIGFYVKLGSAVDIMEAASGYVILAYLSEEERARLVSEWRRRSGRKAPADMEAHLGRIRRVGYEKRASYLVAGVTNISFPVCDAGGHALGALTVPHIQYKAGLLGLDEVVAALQRAAKEINGAIGGRVMPS